jgi:bifunctional DNA-binding transcriptional regulator/antitoxin component of YhaV-PrlF toxin-antitoxin module
MQATLSTNGELVIPASLLKLYGLSAGESVILEARESEIALLPTTDPDRKARLVEGPNGILLLEASAHAPPMNTESADGSSMSTFCLLAVGKATLRTQSRSLNEPLEKIFQFSALNRLAIFQEWIISFSPD